MLAARSVPAGSAKKVLAALLARLTDRYEELAGVVHPVPVYPIRLEAGDTLVRLGGAIVPDLVRFARHDDNRPVRRDCVRLLGIIGSHPDAEKWFLELLDGDVDDLHYAVQHAAAKWEKPGAELSREVLKRPKIRGEIRRDAIQALGKWGDLKTDGPTLRPLLLPGVGQQWAAVTALAQLKDVESLPAFEKIARDAAIDQNTRYPAVNAVLRFAEPKTADKLLLDLIARPKDRLRGFALQRAGERKLMAALPVALAALDDRDWYTRVMADYALRGLAGDRAGVGYDPANPDSKSWRDFWSKRDKK
jgi:HEAT repeat protein